MPASLSMGVGGAGGSNSSSSSSSSSLAPISIFLVRGGGTGDRVLFRYPYAEPKLISAASTSRFRHRTGTAASATGMASAASLAVASVSSGTSLAVPTQPGGLLESSLQDGGGIDADGECENPYAVAPPDGDDAEDAARAAKDDVSVCVLTPCKSGIKPSARP